MIDEKTPSWGIEPVPERLRVLGLFDSLLLWGNLSVSLLVIVIGALLVPALSLRDALLAIVVGAVAGNVLLGLAAMIGADARVPGMVLLRAPLGRRGSYGPTVLNVAQNLGWSTFELIIIATAAASLSQHLFGWQGKWLWTIAFGTLSWGLGMLGPIGFVRRYLRKFAAWALLVAMGYLTYWAISKSSLHAFWARPGEGGFPSFGQAVDLVIGSVVSWTPLAADYTRFSRTRRNAFWGAGIGYFVPTIWCIGLGILIVLARGVSDAQALPGAVAAAGGVAFFALAAITIDESEKAFADIYSTAVSIQNLLPRMSQKLLITLVSATATALALVLNLGNYQGFLYLLGSFFVPLFGVLLADWLLAGAHYSPSDVFATRAFRLDSLAAWLAGFCLYQWLSPVGPSWWTTLVEHTHPGNVSFTASLPAFATSFALVTVAGLLLPREDAARARRGSREPLARPR
ncbi:MAG: putative hydroxymethylpyrimidine transporter CytX [Actinobacteria bacterium]|nr:MAG: putative hydroxymethylpyrimidine transporter CytX [Actinomycetota bacterium]